MSNSTASKTKKVLVVDDEVEVAKPIEYIFRLYNYEPVVATQWTDALQALEKDQFDLITLDLEMPTIDGPTMLKFIREQGITVPVVIVPASITEKTPDDLAEYNVSAFVYKPFKIAHIKEIIENIIGVGSDETIDAGDEDLLEVAVESQGGTVEGEVEEEENQQRTKRRRKHKRSVFKYADKKKETLIILGVVALVCLLLSGFMEAFKQVVASF